ncbi:MAG: hypothetical protein DPW18_09925 [Chloroflexi bacterium]|nr:hypothetical protein [Chloroflexota bacterium]MDL1942572.1 HNH endonuclease [Chloroflexi bacterium CFX2]
MMISAKTREQVRLRANYACEFCGVTETDTGGELTIDHFQPLAKGGNDDPDNLIYCCHRCNQYKQDYWQSSQNDPALWNPRLEPSNVHFLEAEDGTIHPLTQTGSFTIKRLRLNRPPLVAFRLRRKHRDEEIRLLTRYQEIVKLLTQLDTQLSLVTDEQRQLLEEQRELLRLLLGRRI